MNLPQNPERTLPAALLDALRALLGDRLSTSGALREHHGRDESHFPPMPPDAVIFPRSTREIAGAAKLCFEHRAPMIAFGAGSSVEGHVLAVRGGVCFDLTQMNRVLEVNAEDLLCVVEPGVTRKSLNAQLHDSGLFFPLDPGADATLGGMTATRASGTNAVRYGTMKDNVLALTVVLADGSVINTGTRARKSSAGYDLTRLFVGSEGTLGFITQITLRLHPQPQVVLAAGCRFPAVREAVDCVIGIMQASVPIARCELLDAATIGSINAYSKMSLAEAATLFFEFHGSEVAVREQIGEVQAIASEHGGAGFEWADTPEERNRLWSARHNAYFACLALRPNCRVYSTDACVPLSRLADCIAKAQADIARAGLPTVLLGHVGDGNFHLGINFDPSSADETARAEALYRSVALAAIEAGGTSTGEHGIGYSKKEFLLAEHGDAVETMRAIKRALDPFDLMNPGKMLPEAEPTA